MNCYLIILYIHVALVQFVLIPFKYMNLLLTFIKDKSSDEFKNLALRNRITICTWPCMQEG